MKNEKPTTDTSDLLNPAEKKALEVFLSQLHADFGEHIHSVRLFGSKARRESDGESDIDILVVFDDISNRIETIRRLSGIESDINMKFGVLISSYPVEREYFNERRPSSFFRNAVEEGIVL